MRAVILSALLPLALAAACGCTARKPLPARSSTAPVSTTRAFEFHSNPWINLHHFLYQWARSEADRDPSDRRRPVEVAETSVTFASVEWSHWVTALAGYEELVGKDLLFDREMLAIKEGPRS